MPLKKSGKLGSVLKGGGDSAMGHFVPYLILTAQNIHIFKCLMLIGIVHRKVLKNLITILSPKYLAVRFMNHAFFINVGEFFCEKNDAPGAEFTIFGKGV